MVNQVGLGDLPQDPAEQAVSEELQLAVPRESGLVLTAELRSQLQISSHGISQDYFNVFFQLTFGLTTRNFTPEYLQRIRFPDSPIFAKELSYSGLLTGREGEAFGEIEEAIDNLPHNQHAYETYLEQLVQKPRFSGRVGAAEILQLSDRDIGRFDLFVRGVTGLEISENDNPRDFSSIMKLNQLSRWVALAGRYINGQGWNGDVSLPATSRNRYVEFNLIPSRVSKVS